MPEIDLSDTVGLGLIISLDSGVVYSNQTGGTSCLHPELQGVYISMRNDYTEEHKKFLSPEVELSDFFEGVKHRGAGATNGLDLDDVVFIESVLEKYNLDGSIEIARNRLHESHEAWVNVSITGDSDVFSGFGPYPRNAILTWANSD